MTEEIYPFKDSVSALFIDGNNMFPFDYSDMFGILNNYKTIIKNIYISANQISYHKEKKNGKDIVGSLENSGFRICLSGLLDNVDSFLIVDAMKAVERKDIETIILSSGDGDYVPLVDEAKNRGKHVFLITKGYSDFRVSATLSNRVDKHFKIR